MLLLLKNHIVGFLMRRLIYINFDSQSEKKNTLSPGFLPLLTLKGLFKYSEVGKGFDNFKSVEYIVLYLSRLMRKPSVVSEHV